MKTWTNETFAKFLSSRNAAFRALNPGLAGGIQSPVHQPDGRQALAHQQKRAASRPPSPLFRVTILCFCQRWADSDNKTHGYKGLRDAIAEKLGLDDNDRFIEWEYPPPIKSPQTGTLVMIQKL